MKCKNMIHKETIRGWRGCIMSDGETRWRRSTTQTTPFCYFAINQIYSSCCLYPVAFCTKWLHRLWCTIDAYCWQKALIATKIDYLKSSKILSDHIDQELARLKWELLGPDTVLRQPETFPLISVLWCLLFGGLGCMKIEDMVSGRSSVNCYVSSLSYINLWGH